MDMSHEFNPSGERSTANKIVEPRPGETDERITGFSSSTKFCLSMKVILFFNSEIENVIKLIIRKYSLVDT